MKKYLSRWYDYPAYWTATRDSSDIQRWNPRLRCRAAVAMMEQYDQVPDPNLRRFYRLGARFNWFKNCLQPGRGYQR